MSGLHDASALRDKSVIITGTFHDTSTSERRSKALTETLGGASGLGLATATHFAKAGAYVTIADVQDIPGQRVAHDLNLQGHHVSYVHCDVTDWLSSVLAFKHAALFGPGGSLDVVGLFAGVAGDGGSLTDQVMDAAEPSLDPGHIPPEPALSAIRVNLEGLYKNAWLALYYMQLPSKMGSRRPFSKSLILVSSLAGYSDMPGNTDYNASKCEYEPGNPQSCIDKCRSWRAWYLPWSPTYNCQVGRTGQPHCAFLDKHAPSPAEND
jgi:5'-hydroxyaverantin dehydrogenase